MWAQGSTWDGAASWRLPRPGTLCLSPCQPAQHRAPAILPRCLLLSRRAEGHGDDGFRVPLQGAGAARHRSHPEHGLGLVDDVEDSLRLHHLPRQRLLQRRDDFGILDVEGERQRLLLEDKRWGQFLPGRLTPTLRTSPAGAWASGQWWGDLSREGGHRSRCPLCPSPGAG